MQRLAKYGIATIASIAILAMALSPIITNVSTAYADTTPTLISNTDSGKPVPLTVKAPVDSEQKLTEDLYGHMLVAFRLANYTQVCADDTSYILQADATGSAAIANVKSGAYVIFDQTQANTRDPAHTDKASIPMVNGTGVYNGDTLLTKLVRPDPTDTVGTKTVTYDLDEVFYKPTKVTITKTANTDNATIGKDITFTLITQVPNWR